MASRKVVKKDAGFLSNLAKATGRSRASAFLLTTLGALTLVRYSAALSNFETRCKYDLVNFSALSEEEQDWYLSRCVGSQTNELQYKNTDFADRAYGTN